MSIPQEHDFFASNNRHNAPYVKDYLSNCRRKELFVSIKFIGFC
jgi:hypothetical protein